MAKIAFDADELAKLRRQKAEDDRKLARRQEEIRARGLAVPPDSSGSVRPYMSRLRQLEELERTVFEGQISNTSAMKVVLIYWGVGAVALAAVLYWWLH